MKNNVSTNFQISQIILLITWSNDEIVEWTNDLRNIIYFNKGLLTE